MSVRKDQQHARRWDAFREAWRRDDAGERCVGFNGPTGALQCEMPLGHDGVHQARSSSGDWHVWPDYARQEAMVGIRRLRARIVELEREVAELRSRLLERTA